MSILVLTSNTLSTPAAAGQIEYESPIFAATPIGTQRGIIPTQQYYRLNADLAGANVTTAQSVFGVGVTLSASTVYAFEIAFGLAKSAGTTSHTLAFGFGGTVGITNIYYDICSSNMSGSASTIVVNSATTRGYVAVSTPTTVTNATVSALNTASMIIKGTLSISTGGTLIPQYTLSAAPGGAYSTAAGSYMSIYPLGASGAAINEGTWA